jgi:hypothetical protein
MKSCREAVTDEIWGLGFRGWDLGFRNKLGSLSHEWDSGRVRERKAVIARRAAGSGPTKQSLDGCQESGVRCQ